jgi:L-ascorbate metabolism protein UlaG (beta-lactamase superfamily)
MKITHYVNAMVLLESARTRVLCDPWVSFDDHADSNAYNFPRPRWTRDEVAAISPDFIYITHTHPDHFDPRTLALFRKDTPVLISHYAENFTQRVVRKLGFADVRVAVPATGLALNGEDHCWIEPAAASPEVDSTAVFSLDGKTVLLATDNPFHRGHCVSLRERLGKIDVALVPYAGYGPYPMFYENLTAAEKRAEAARRKQAYYDIFADFVDALRPDYALPFGAGLIAGGPKALLHIHSGIGTRSEAVAHALARTAFKPVLLSEGCRYDFTTDTRSGAFVETTYEDAWDYVELIARKPGTFDEGGAFYVAPSEQIDLTRLLEAARQTQRKWQTAKRTTSDIAYYLDVGDERLYRLSLADDRVVRVREREIADGRYEIFRLPYGLLLGLLTRHYVWSNVKTLYMSFYRRPNVYDPELELMMSYLQI